MVVGGAGAGTGVGTIRVTGVGTTGLAGAAIWLADWPVAAVSTRALILSLMPELVGSVALPLAGPFLEADLERREAGILNTTNIRS